MNALDHFSEGERLLAESQRKPAMGLEPTEVPVYALLAEQARAHFEAARTMIAAINALDMPAHNYEAWEKIALAPRKPAGPAPREFEDLDDGGEETPSCTECGVDAVIRGGVWAHAAPTVGEHAVVLAPRASANGGEGRG